MSKTRSLHHIVFSTRNRQKTIPADHKRELYAYLYGQLRNKNCHLLRMNGRSEHVHMLVDINPSIALGTLVQTLKQSSSMWLKHNLHFPDFVGWNNGYYAMSLSIKDVDACKAYIISQEQHHARCDFMSEMKAIAEEFGLEWYENDWNDK